MRSAPPYVDTISVDADGHPVVAHVAGAPAGTGPTIIASHGITANAISWSRVAEELGDAATFAALDHRGRGESSEHPGPYGLASHARDCIAVLDRLEADRGVLVGHSMGAFVVARAATDFVDRVSAVVLVDGGLPIEVPEGIDPSEAVDAVVGPAVARLSVTWTDHDDLYGMWKDHPAFREWTRWHERYVNHDVTPNEDGSLRCRVSEDAVRSDGPEVIVDPAMSRLVFDLSPPTWLLRAPRGLLDDPDSPLLRPEVVADLRDSRPDIDIVEMAADVNHYNIIWGDSAVPVLVDVVRAALARA